MSRYYNYPARGHPPSPPDTELAVEPAMMNILPPLGAAAAVEPRQQRAESDIASPYSRRAPAIFYKQNDLSALPRDGTGSQRGGVRRPPAHHHRWLVIVTPPPIITDVDRADDPSRRSSAVLLPLFPTMYGQLAAIAREFNLPSTTGLRVYLHLPEGTVGAGLLMPRVSDDVWPLLWQQYLSSEERSQLPTPIPISGRIEFDLDMQTARWYSSWARSRGQISISRGPQLSGDLTEDNGSVVRGPEISPPESRPTHIRQLSLLERRPSSARGVPFPINTAPRAAAVRRPSDDLASDFAAPTASATRANTVIHNPRDEVESLVQKWRANTPTVKPGAMHMSPEPSPRSVDPEDFSWSISSAGPLTYDPLDSAGLSDYSPANRSMHMAERAAGSVILTPSTATSFGPPRTGFSHEGSLISNVSRYPSPDLGARAMSEVPLTPSTATSWGPIDDNFDYANVFTELDAGERTPDLGERAHSPSSQPRRLYDDAAIFSHAWPISELLPGFQSVHLPTTYPNVTIYPAAYPSIEIYPPLMTLAVAPVPLNMSVRIERAYPNLEIYPAVYPFNMEHIYPAVRSAPVKSRVVPDSQSLSSDVYPFTWDLQYKNSLPRSHVVSSGNLLSLDSSPSSPRKALPASFEGVEISSLVYPFAWNYEHSSAKMPRHLIMDEPSLTPTIQDSSVKLRAGYPSIIVYAPVYPHSLERIYPEVNINRLSVKPTTAPRSLAVRLPLPATAILIGTLYPFHLQHIYPAIENRVGLKGPRVIQSTHIRSRTAFVNKALEVEYPTILIYKPVYPYNLDHIYPVYEISPILEEQYVAHPSPSFYPFLCIYPSVYPNLTVYPERAGEMGEMSPRREVIVKLAPAYPCLGIYNPVYPYIEIYPSRHDDLYMLNDAESTRQSLPYLSSPTKRSLHPSMPQVPVDLEEEYQEVDEAVAYREELLKSSISFYSDDFDLEVDGSAQHSRRSSEGTMGALGGLVTDESDYDERELDEMDSPTRRFYLARQRDLRRSGDFVDDEEGDSVGVPFEFDNVPMTLGAGRPSLSLAVPPEASGFFDDEDEDADDRDDEYDDEDLDFEATQTDDEMYAAYEVSRSSRFPAPNLSAVTEEASPFTGLSAMSALNRTAGSFPPSPEFTGTVPNRPPKPQRSPLAFGHDSY